MLCSREKILHASSISICNKKGAEANAFAPLREIEIGKEEL
ncbi:hypothetical protein BTH41_01175 [Bacillus mycoides]|nr:hypothetical protein BTH41_01175 [Bacillus mycoides]